MTSNDLIDAVVRQFFDPDAVAALAHGDEEVRLRRLPETGTTIDPLDGVEVFVRRTIAGSLTMRRHPGAASLLTERQAWAAGWPTARLANFSVVLAWALFVKTEPRLASPVLLAADEGDTASLQLHTEARLPALEELLRNRRRGFRIDSGAIDRDALARQDVPDLEGRSLASLNGLLRDWFGIDAASVELPSDHRAPDLISANNARAMACFAWTAATALELAAVMDEEHVKAVRLKTDADAALAGEPGATAANLALLLATAIRHGSGYTVHLLQPRDDVAAALVEAGQRVAHGRCNGKDDSEAEATDRLEIEDLAGRGYIHIGRRAVGRGA